MDTKKGCLLIHGFGGSVEEINPLADKLRAAGCEVACPVLKGHTGQRRDLKGISYQDWVMSAETALSELAECDRIYFVGFSMGGLIALHLALKFKPAGVVTLNAPIYYWDLKRIALNIIDDIKRRKPDNIKYYLRSSGSFPLSALLNFKILLNQTKPLIKEVRCPLFIAQALQDDTVRKSSAAFIYKNAASEKKTLKFYEGSGHLILWSKAAGKVIEDVQDFVGK